MIILGGVVLLCTVGLIEVPFLSSIVYAKKVADLGIESSPQALQSFQTKLNSIGIKKYPPSPTRIEVTDVEFTSFVNSLCMDTDKKIPQSEGNGIGILPLETLSEAPGSKSSGTIDLSIACELMKNFQIKFREGEYAASAHIFWPIEADITVMGTISIENEKMVDFSFKRAYLGNLPMPNLLIRKIESRAKKEFNNILKQMQGLMIQDLKFLEGKGVFKGIINLDIFY